MKKKLAVVLAALLFSTAIFAYGEEIYGFVFESNGESLTIIQAFEKAENKNATLATALLDYEQAELDYDKGKRDLKKLNAVYDKDKDQYIMAEIANEYAWGSAQKELEATRNGVDSNIEQLYYGSRQLGENYAIQQENLAIATKVYQQTQKKYELGLVNKQVVLQAELAMIRADNAIMSAKHMYDKNRMLLSSKLGYGLMEDVSLTDAVSFEAGALPEIETAIEMAIGSRKEMLGAAFQLRYNELNKAIVQRQYTDNTDQYKNAQIDYEKAVDAYESARDAVEMQVRGNYLDVIEAERKVSTGEKSVELTKESLRISQLSYDAGLVILTDVSQAQNAYIQARLGLSSAVLDYSLALTRFQDSIAVGRNEVTF
ncbi:MAG: TolC family protein [Peptostreptococcaceae bacterium]|nr:TolC family protein [Peptostreptococcaceae bacterium]